MSNEAGKGSSPRPVNKRAYDQGYLRIFGKKCPTCLGEGCEVCYGLGYVPSEKEAGINQVTYTPAQRQALEDIR